MTRLYLIRHGETEWNRANNRFCGRSDVELSEEGKRQGEALACWLETKNLDALYASPLKRAVDTAAFVARKTGLEIRRESGFSEIDFGMWEGLVQSQIEHNYPEDWRKWFVRPDDARAGGTGETASQVVRRYGACVRELCVRHPHANVAVVSHSTAIRIFLASVLNMPLRAYRTLVLHNTGVCAVEASAEGTCKLLLFNGKPEPVGTI
ncbi:histidine phosphatase family protein [Cohnella algarum]|uniref:histidine phosphatase family protein n=1 Tax=Cohnella algarum TaxID=2044859 RepID=UPI001966DDD7|nr:histidine phosphatase family protein [Cohnella algarum]MBN2982450.1 histidine phosphatase family protein [Cohnella algarum]